MESKGYGQIINIATIGGLSAMSAFAPNYSAAKGGVIAFTRSVAFVVIGEGVHVNCIAPGGVSNTAMGKGTAGSQRSGPEGDPGTKNGHG